LVSPPFCGPYEPAHIRRANPEDRQSKPQRNGIDGRFAGKMVDWPGGGRNIAYFRGEDSMRLISFSVTIALALLSPAALAQPRTPETSGETIGHPPPLPGPPAIGEPTMPPTAGPASTAPKGYTGAYAPPSDNAPTPYFRGPEPQVSTGPGLNVVAPDGVSIKTVKAVPCSIAARETDGTTTCVGIPDKSARRKRR